MTGGKSRKAAPRKVSSGIAVLTVKLAGLSSEARGALERAPNRSALVRAAIEAYVAGDATRRALDEIRAALARIETLLASGAAPTHAGDAGERAARPGGDEDAEALALLAGAVGSIVKGGGRECLP